VGPRRRRFLMSEVPLYVNAIEASEHSLRMLAVKSCSVFECLSIGFEFIPRNLAVLVDG
jgi:hypothetical protein